MYRPWLPGIAGELGPGVTKLLGAWGFGPRYVRSLYGMGREDPDTREWGDRGQRGEPGET